MGPWTNVLIIKVSLLTDGLRPQPSVWIMWQGYTLTFPYMMYHPTHCWLPNKMVMSYYITTTRNYTSVPTTARFESFDPPKFLILS